MKQKLLTILTLLVLCVTGTWATDVETTYNYVNSATVATMTSNDYFSAASNPTQSGNCTFSDSGGALLCTLTKSTSSVITFTFTAKDDVELNSFTFNSYVNSDKIKSASVDYYKNSDTPVNENITLPKNSAGNTIITPASTISLSNGDIFTIKVNLNNTDTSKDRYWKLSTITLNASLAGVISLDVVGSSTRSMALGSETAIEVSANNVSGSETYQWYRTTSDDTSCESGTEISGEDETSFTPNEGAAGTYYYYCVVTDGVNSAKTDLITVTVVAPLEGWVIFDGLIDTEKRSSPVVYNTVSLTYETSSSSIVDVSTKTNNTGRPYNKGLQLSKSTDGYLKFTIPNGYQATSIKWAFSGTGNRTIMLSTAKINSTTASGYIATLTSSVTSGNIVAGEYISTLAAGDYYICEGGTGNWQIDALALTLENVPVTAPVLSLASSTDVPVLGDIVVKSDVAAAIVGGGSTVAAQIMDGETKVADVTGTLSGDGKTLTFDNTTKLAYETDYTLSIAADVLQNAEDADLKNIAYNLDFTTAAKLNDVTMSDFVSTSSFTTVPSTSDLSLAVNGSQFESNTIKFRWGGDKTFTVTSAAHKIVAMQLTYTVEGDVTPVVNVNTGEFNLASKMWIGNASSVTFTNGYTASSAGNIYISSIKVYYEGSDEEPVPVTITAAKYATFASDSDLDFSGVDGLYAYTATVAGDELTFNKVTEAKAGEGLLLYADVNTSTVFYVPVATNSPAAVSGNKLVRGTDAAVASTDDEGATYNYVLSNNGGEVNFYRAAGKVVGTNKAYLKNISATATSKFFLPTGEDETDGIKSVQGSRFTVNGEAYNLAGQRVGKDYKGIVIVNGKKIVRK